MIKAAYRDGAFDPLLVPASISMELHRQASPEDGLEVGAPETAQRLLDRPLGSDLYRG